MFEFLIEFSMMNLSCDYIIIIFISFFFVQNECILNSAKLLHAANPGGKHSPPNISYSSANSPRSNRIFKSLRENSKEKWKEQKLY